MATFEPKPFGKYFLVDKLAVGGMAEIYKAKTFGVDGFEKMLAIKKILPHYSADKEFISMLTDEAKLAVRLSHTNIVQIYDLGKVGDDYYISMEYIDGINLRELINRGKELGEAIPVPVCLYIASEICKGLDYAHSKRDENNQPLGIVHRDISPQNVLISFEGETKIVDFGIAKAAMNISHTTAGILKGKVTYMSSEQALGKPVDARTDIFSAGIILYEMLTGERLFTGETQFEVLSLIQKTHITEESLSKKIPTEVRPILAKSLAFNTSERYPTGGDFQIALTKTLYSRYVDFSPRQLADLIRKWFAPELKIKRKRTQEQTIVDSNTRSVMLAEEVPQESIVHRDETPRPPQVLMQQTTKPDEWTKPGSLRHPVEEGATDKKPVLAGKKRRIWPWAIAGLAVLAGIFYFATRPEPKKRVMGVVEITSEPLDAKIFIDGTDTGEITPATVGDLSLNIPHQIRIEKEGYKPWETEVDFEGQTHTAVNAPLQLIPSGFLEIQSTPAGAQIFLDDKDTGNKTPFQLTSLDIGKTYRVRLLMEGFEPFEESIVLNDENPVTLSGTLKEILPGSIEVTSNPAGAHIFLDGKDTGLTTPARLSKLIVPQTYRISLRKVDYLDSVHEINLKSKDTAQIKAELELRPELKIAKLELKTNITGAQVKINGRSVGNTPTTLETKPGTLTVQISKKGYKTLSQEITLLGGETKSLDLTLEKEIASVEEPPPPVTSKPPVTTRPPVTSPPPDSVSSAVSIRVDSSPRGASVVIDGQKSGVTPIVIKNLRKDQSHTVVVSLPGYRSWTKTVQTSKSYTELVAPLQRE